MNKKICISSFFIIAFCYTVSFAQNSVTIKQEGTRNKAIITQSVNADSALPDIMTNQPCYETEPGAMKKMLNLIVLKTEDGSGKQVYEITGRKDNKLYLSQQGYSAEAVIGIWKRPDSIAAAQHGAKNKIVLTLREPTSSDQDGDTYDLTQKGQTNFIYVGPCREGDDEERTDSDHTIEIKQQGEGNTAVVEQGRSYPRIERR